jgi:acetyl esterase/lipase
MWSYRITVYTLDAVRRALAFVKAEVSTPIILMGHSAGAQLGSLLALEPDNSNLAAFIGMAGPYDFYPFTEDEHWDLFSPDYEISQPVNFVSATAPPFYLLHGEDDQRVRRGHSKSLMQKQCEVGGVATREVYKDMGHVDIILSFSPFHRRGSQVVSDIQTFISSKHVS